MKISVENMPVGVTEEGLKDMFGQIGEVQSVTIKSDLLAMLTSRPTETGVVDMTLEVDAYRAINCFEGAAFSDRKIHVKETYPMLEKAKNMFEHLADGYSLAGNKALADYERWKERHNIN